MKKCYTIIILFTLLTFNAFSQIKVGIKQGINISSLITDSEEVDEEFYSAYELKSMAGFHIGGFLSYRFTDNLYLNTELMFSQQGARAEVVEQVVIGFSRVSIEYVQRRRLNYILIPATVKYQSTSGFNFEAGFALGILLSGRDSYDTKTNVAQLLTGVAGLDELFGIKDQDSKEFHSTIDLLATIGVGYELPSGLSFNMRYMAGLGNSLDESILDPNDIQILSTSLLQLSVGFPIYGN